MLFVQDGVAISRDNQDGIIVAGGLNSAYSSYGQGTQWLSQLWMELEDEIKIKPDEPRFIAEYERRFIASDFDRVMRGLAVSKVDRHQIVLEDFKLGKTDYTCLIVTGMQPFPVDPEYLYIQTDPVARFSSWLGILEQRDKPSGRELSHYESVSMGSIVDNRKSYYNYQATTQDGKMVLNNRLPSLSESHRSSELNSLYNQHFVVPDYNENLIQPYTFPEQPGMNLMLLIPNSRMAVFDREFDRVKTELEKESGQQEGKDASHAESARPQGPRRAAPKPRGLGRGVAGSADEA